MGAIIMCSFLTILSIGTATYVTIRDRKRECQRRVKRHLQEETLSNMYTATGGQKIDIDNGEIMIF